LEGGWRLKKMWRREGGERWRNSERLRYGRELVERKLQQQWQIGRVKA